MLQDHAKKLAELSLQKSALDIQISAVKDILKEEMQAQDLKSIKSDEGVVSYVTRKNYTYSPEVKALQEQVGLLKIKEEKQGVAEVSTTEYVQFSPPKPPKE